MILRLAMSMLEVASLRGLQQGDTTLLVRLMDLVKHRIDPDEPQFEAALIEKLQASESAELLQIWHLAGLAAKQRQRAGPVPQKRMAE